MNEGPQATTNVDPAVQQLQRKEELSQSQHEEAKDKHHHSQDHNGSSLFFLGDSAFSVYEEMAVQLRRLGWKETRSKAAIVRCDIVLGDRFTIPYSVLRCERLPATSRYCGCRWINYFHGSHVLTLKASMARILSGLDTTQEEWMPRSFVLGGDQRRRQDDRDAFLQWMEMHPEETWIIKPSSGSKGKDILLTRGVSEIETFIKGLNPNSRSIFVAQRYIDHPLLYRGRKFDVRVWAFLKTPYDIYVFSQGSCRTSSVLYDAGDVGNTLAHLTNHCLQKGSPQFGQYEESNELWFPQLSAYLQEIYNDDVLGKHILPQIANIIRRTLLVMKDELEVLPDVPYKCFQLFGYDVIIDDQLNVFLLEINGSPGVAIKFLQPVVRETLLLVNGGDAPRVWDVNSVRFVKLWGESEASPDGATRARVC